jgi:acetoin utilization deacetylase AcuC-like enzyme
MSTAFLYDERFLDHNPGTGHPERRERLERTIAHLRGLDWFSTLVQVEPQLVERRWLETTHSEALIERALTACRNGDAYLDVADVGICADSYDIARLAAGGVLRLADSIVSGDSHNAFALSRPPGHHAEHDMALGFCLFNNIAICARYLQTAHGLDKIAIVDWDVHHGNGTQHTFEDDPSVLYVSTHQYPFYPGTGAASETGTGKGSGATLNCPMPAGAGDALYQQAFMERIIPAIDTFKPDAILISAGFDAHAADPLAQIELTTTCYPWMTARMMELADKHCHGRVLSMLEGGYNIDRLPECVEQHIEVLTGRNAKAGS